MDIYNGPVEVSRAATVRFEVKSSVSQLSKNIGTYMASWQNISEVTTLKLSLAVGGTESGGAANFMFISTVDPIQVTLTYPGLQTGDPDQVVTKIIRSAFFADAAILAWTITNTSLTKDALVEVIYATADAV